MCKKFIIELQENSQSFCILTIMEVKWEKKGFLKYFTIYGNAEMHEVTDFDEHKGYKEKVDELVKKAESICEENGAILWSY
jgi:hypothetical protein